MYGNNNTAGLKLVDRLADVMLIRARDEAAYVHFPYLRGLEGLPSALEKLGVEVAAIKQEAIACNAALEAWEKGGRVGPKPVKPPHVEQFETDMRVAAASWASLTSGFGPKYRGGPAGT